MEKRKVYVVNDWTVERGGMIDRRDPTARFATIYTNIHYRPSEIVSVGLCRRGVLLERSSRGDYQWLFFPEATGCVHSHGDISITFPNRTDCVADNETRLTLHLRDIPVAVYSERYVEEHFEFDRTPERPTEWP